jgi:hypothetical protein
MVISTVSIELILVEKKAGVKEKIPDNFKGLSDPP